MAQYVINLNDITLVHIAQVGGVLSNTLHVHPLPWGDSQSMRVAVDCDDEHLMAMKLDIEGSAKDIAREYLRNKLSDIPDGGVPWWERIKLFSREGG